MVDRLKSIQLSSEAFGWKHWLELNIALTELLSRQDSVAEFYR